MASKSGRKKKKAAAREPFVAGWTFWLIVFVVLLVPTVVGARMIKSTDATLGQSLGVGAVLAALGAGIVAWATNAMLGIVRKRRHAAKEKKSR
jgi:protein-S-isoprenylcysteine O-methyltransferase Ste14